VTAKRAQQWCASKGEIPYYETSAKEATNVEQAFQKAAELALAQESESEQYNTFPDNIQLSANQEQPKPRSCPC
jgi:Ras-related protein Rab-7A